MIISKKNFLKLFTLSLVLCASTRAEDALLKQEDDVTGRDRVVNIALHKETGIGSHSYKNAELKGASDLNLQEVTQFFGCKTDIGAAFLHEALQHPLNDQKAIFKRQNAIRTLVENPELKRKVDLLLSAARKEEQEVMILLSDFFKGKTCPELKQLEVLKEQSPVAYAMQSAAIKSLPVRLLAFVYNTATIGLMGYQTYYLGWLTSLAKKDGVMGEFFGKPCEVYKIFGAITLASAATTGLPSYLAYKDYSFALEKREKIHALTNIVRLTRKLEKLCAEHDISKDFIIKEMITPEGKNLASHLKAPRYSYKNRKLVLPPYVHVFMYKLCEQEKHLGSIFASLAEMDAYNAIATKIVEHRNSGAPMCFVTFADDARSVITMEGMWNVLVKNPVANNIDEQAHIILTGPNAGGKTTSIRSILQNIILGQTFGVAAAASCDCSLFDVVHSYLTISDDVMNGLSLFASEVKRAQGIVERIKQLEPGQKFFFALDELFTGTAAADGEQCAYSFVKRLAQEDNATIQFVYATHFDKLKELGRDSQICKNYKVGAPTKDERGAFVYPFTLCPGENDSYIALELAQQANLFA